MEEIKTQIMLCLFFSISACFTAGFQGVSIRMKPRAWYPLYQYAVDVVIDCTSIRNSFGFVECEIFWTATDSWPDNVSCTKESGSLYDYPDAGPHTVIVTCLGGIVRKEETFYLGDSIYDVEVRVSGLKHIIPVLWPVENNTVVQISFKGLNVALTTIFSHNNETETTNIENSVNTVSMVIGKDAFSSSGLYLFKCILENASLNTSVTVHTVFLVQEQTGLINCSTSNDVREGDYVQIEAMPIGDVFYEMTIMNENGDQKKIVSVYCQKKTKYFALPYNFNEIYEINRLTVIVRMTNMVDTDDFIISDIAIPQSVPSTRMLGEAIVMCFEVFGRFYSNKLKKHQGTTNLKLSINFNLPFCKDKDYHFEYEWKLYYGRDNQSKPVYLRHTSSPAIFIKANTLDIGLHMCVLEVCVVTSGRECKECSTFLEVIAPPLRAMISGTRKRTVHYHDGPFTLNAAKSEDPASGFPSIRKLPLTEAWFCLTADENVLTESKVDEFLANRGRTNLSDGQEFDNCTGQKNYSAKTYTIDPRGFGMNRWYLVCYSLQRGKRSSSDCIALKLIHWRVLDMSIKCISNCVTNICSKSRHGTLQLDADVKGNLNNLSLTYRWYLQKWDPNLNIFSGFSNLPGIPDGIGLSVPKSMLQPGHLYMISMECKSPGMIATKASDVYLINIPPYGGSCSVDRTNGTAALDLFCVTCTGWKDEHDRRYADSIFDDDQLLLYDVLQIIDTNPVSSFIIVDSSEKHRNCFHLNQGRIEDYQTMIEVKIKDSCKDSSVWNTTVFVHPVTETAVFFETNNNETETLINFITQTDKSIETSLNFHDTNRIVNQIGTFVTVLRDIDDSQTTDLYHEYPPKGNGGLIDMNPDTNTTVTAKEALEHFLRPAITTNVKNSVQKVKEKYGLVIEQLLHGTVDDQLAEDAVTLTKFTEVLMAFIGSSGTHTNKTKDSVLNAMSDVINLTSSLIHNDDPEVKQTLTALVNLLGQAILTIVPDEIQTIIGTVKNLKTARQYNDALFNLATEKDQYRRELADMTPDERNFILSKKQEQSVFHVDQERIRVLKLTNSMDGLTEAMTKLPMCTGCSINYGHTGISIAVDRDQAAVLSKKEMAVADSTFSLEILDAIQTHPMTLVVAQATRNPFLSRVGGENIAAFVTSPVLTVAVENIHGVSSGDVVFTQKVETQLYEHISPSIDEDDASQMVVATSWKGFEGDNFCVSIKMSSDVSGYWVYVKHDSRPTIIDYESKKYFRKERENGLCFSTGKAGILFYGLKTDNTAWLNAAKHDSMSDERSSKKYPPYEIATATVACLSYHRTEQRWESDTCRARWLPHKSIIQCSCQQPVDLIFTNTFKLAPNKIDLSTVFLRFSPQDQAAVLATLSLTGIVYVVVLIWARGKDRNDITRWSIRPLVDCNPVDNYYYLMRVYTGKRPRAGTTSRVGFILMGHDEDETSSGPRELSDGYQAEFPTGSIINFMLSTSRCLGQLEYMRIWHDNSGDGHRESWYLSKIEIIDVQTKESFVFKAEKWLALDSEDRHVSCTLPVLGDESKASLKNCFVGHVEENFHDEHLWLSVFYRPSPSVFSRAQRWSCALVFLMAVMLSDAMFCNVGENYETPVPLKFGPFEISLQQVYISGICAVITTPTLLLAYMFRLSKEKTPAKRRKSDRYKINISSNCQEPGVIRSDGDFSFVEGYSKLPYRFPNWTVNLAWFVVVILIATSAFFILLYSMEWGRQKSEQWLTTFFMAFFQSFVCIDTLRIALVALLFTYLIGRGKGPSIVVERNVILGQYPTCLRLKTAPKRNLVPVLRNETVEETRLSHEKESKIRKSVIDIFVTFCLIIILLGISFSNRDDRSYHLHKDIEQKLLYPGNQASFRKITTMNDYYKWLNQTVIPNLFPENHTNGERLHWRLREFIEGGASYRMGPPRLRQLRAKKQTCTIPYIGALECTGGYQSSAQDTGSYCKGWTNAPCNPQDKIYKFSLAAWQYTSPSKLWGFPIIGFLAKYDDGGYISTLDVNRDVSIRILNELYKGLWLDKRTRSVTLEFTLYNANVNMFVYNVFMIEFAETGGAVPFYMILPVRIHQHSGQLGLHVLVLEVIFLVFMVVFLTKTTIAIWNKQFQYFADSGNCLNFSFLIIGIVSIGLYVNRLWLAQQALSEFKKEPKEFVNLYRTAFWDLVFVVCLGCLNSTAVIKLVRLFGYNKRVGSVVNIFTDSSKELLWFCILFLYIYLAYAIFGYLLFGSNLKSYMSLYKSLSTLFLSMIGKSRFVEMEGINPIMSKIYFLVFIFVVVYIILTMLLSIWTESIHHARVEARESSAEEIIQYVINALKSLLGFKVKKQTFNRRKEGVKKVTFNSTPASV